MTYISRSLTSAIKKNLQHFPALAILGPRQCGKSTFVRHIAGDIDNTMYLDLEKMSDRNKLSDPEMFFGLNKDKLIILDEIQQLPEIFHALRSIIDEQKRNGQILVLGSASRDLIRQSSESLAGRIAYFRLTPFTLEEISDGKNADEQKLKTYWLRGGFPKSYLADDDDVSYMWRQNFTETFLQRDLPQMGIDIPPETAYRLWKMCAHNQGQLLNVSNLAGSIGLTSITIKRYLDLFQGTFMLRMLQPIHTNQKKRLVKSPKIYIRDTGILHTLLHINSMNELFSHPVFGPSWESMVIENILTKYETWEAGFYRTSNGAEIDLVLERGDQRLAIECKATSAPQPSKGFYMAMDDLQISKGWIIAPIEGPPYPLSSRVIVSNLNDFIQNKTTPA
jgi:uncharacterized protein